MKDVAKLATFWNMFRKKKSSRKRKQISALFLYSRIFTSPSFCFILIPSPSLLSQLHPTPPPTHLIRNLTGLNSRHCTLTLSFFLNCKWRTGTLIFSWLGKQWRPRGTVGTDRGRGGEDSNYSMMKEVKKKGTVSP